MHAGRQNLDDGYTTPTDEDSMTIEEQEQDGRLKKEWAAIRQLEQKIAKANKAH